MDDSGVTGIGSKSSNNVDNEPITVDEQSPKRSPKRRANQSEVWDHFQKLEKVEGQKQKAVCNHCGQIFTCDSNSNGTSSMKTHIKVICRQYEFSQFNLNKNPGKRQKTLAFEPVNGGGTGTIPKLTAVSFSVEACRKALAEMIILDELPFCFVEGQGFKRFIYVVQPKWENPPGRLLVAKDCMKIYQDGKKSLKRVLKDQRICLTTDTWTSLQNLNYMCLTAHFIDCDWKLHKKILNFCLVPNHKGETLGKVVEECLVKWGIDKFLTITIDNAKSNDGIIDFLKKKTKKRDTTILDHEYLHVRCCAHILNLVVREGLKDVDVSIARVRNIVRYVRSSPQRYAKFRSCCDKEKIVSKLVPCLDVATRWNATYFMLERALMFQKAFERLEDEDNLSLNVGVREDEIGVESVDNELEGEVHGGLIDLMNFEKQHERGQGKGRGKHVTRGTPSGDDWNVVEMYVEVLKVFYILTEKFSGSLYVTCNTFFKEIMAIKTAIVKLENSDNPKLKALASGMIKKYDKYWGKFDKINSLLLYANVLDPRYKFVYVRWSLNKHYEQSVVENKVIEIQEGMLKLFNWYEKKSVEHGKTQNVGEFFRSEKNSKEYMNFCEEMDDEFERHMEEENNMVSKSELERYWLESNEDSKVHGDKFDVLAWWKVNSPRYPILSQMVRGILAIPVSTVASESAFSTGGRILDPYRTSLSPKVAEALICAQNWLRSPTQISLRDALDEVEALESSNTL
ncbi:hypothetical protein RHMOL_Rhmol08G0161800 [Rhododendron molle]|uniref:Uncharacterized protein n=1 Tax=Rhododendron molle TaxID=49168 RepID=A0ACC0MQZ4_RHOML|nr:hypothetical protein RHMOL_Rhmol08G0161800 [Rhododendron molle]